jgi:uncharacterized protein YoxC
MEIPLWWLIVSGLFFVVHFLFYLVLIWVVVTKIKPAIDGVNAKVEELSTKVQEIGTKVDELTTNVKDRVDDVGSKASSILASIEHIAQTVSKQTERFAPMLVGTMTSIKAIKALWDIKHGSSPAEATTNRSIRRKKPEKRKRFIFF